MLGALLGLLSLVSLAQAGQSTTQPASSWIHVDVARSAARPTSAPAGRMAAPFQTDALSGEVIGVPEQFRDKLVLLVFWATWCDECARELPNWKRTYDRFHNAGLELIGLACDARTGGRVEDVLSYVNANAVPWPTVFGAASDIARDYGVASLPRLFLIDGASGRLLAEGDLLRGAGLARVVSDQLGRRALPPASQPASGPPSK